MENLSLPRNGFVSRALRYLKEVGSWFQIYKAENKWTSGLETLSRYRERMRLYDKVFAEVDKQHCAVFEHIEALEEAITSLGGDCKLDQFIKQLSQPFDQGSSDSYSDHLERANSYLTTEGNISVAKVLENELKTFADLEDDYIELGLRIDCIKYEITLLEGVLWEQELSNYSPFGEPGSFAKKKTSKPGKLPERQYYYAQLIFAYLLWQKEQNLEIQDLSGSAIDAQIKKLFNLRGVGYPTRQVREKLLKGPKTNSTQKLFEALGNFFDGEASYQKPFVVKYLRELRTKL